MQNGREKKSNWRQQHEDFISAIRAAKLATRAMKEGRPLPPPPPPSINPGDLLVLKLHLGLKTEKLVGRTKTDPLLMVVESNSL